LIDCVVGDIPAVACYLDDIVITDVIQPVHIVTVRKVLENTHNAGLKVKRQKCSFMMPKITYLGHDIDATGIHSTEEKIRAIKKAPIRKMSLHFESSLEL